MEKIRGTIGARTLKTALAAGVAIFLSILLGLSYAGNSGIIAILSVQNTKKKSSEIAKQRLFATVIAFAISSGVFLVLGFTPFAFAVYLLIFIPISVRLGLNEAIVPCSVLVTHLLAVESVAPAWLLNEFMQMVIGAGMGLLVNIHIPSLRVELENDINEIEAKMKEILHNMAGCLRHENFCHNQSLFDELESCLKKSRERVLQESYNYSGDDVNYYIRYMDMRNSQFEVLKHLGRYVDRVHLIDEQAYLAAAITDQVADDVSNLSPKKLSLEQLQAYRTQLSGMKLPKTREEFESQASIHEFMSDLELLIELKRNFML
ncbi:MAG: aromatic acid exporter family protein [Clostridium sp.]|nr:aromatic acid exporter family protein [Clostridium sp.]